MVDLVVYVPAVKCLVAGVFGAALRIAIQWRRDGVVPGGEADFGFGLLLEGFIGGAAGWISWMIGEDTLGAFVFGYAAPDAIENFMSGKKPS